MTQIDPVLPQGWSRARGYSHALVYSGRTIRVAGQLAVESGAGPVPDDMSMGAQCAQALANVVACVEPGGGRAEEIANLRVFVTDMAGLRSPARAHGHLLLEVSIPVFVILLPAVQGSIWEER